MRFTIRHRTLYRYSSPVKLNPHRLLFHPRNDGAQRVIRHHLNISPQPTGRNDYLDLEGNRVTQIWFDEAADHLEIEANMQIETLCSNAFNFILAPEATVLPIVHKHDLLCARAYLERIEPDDAVTAYAAELSIAVNRDTLGFLDQLNRRIFAGFAQMHRDTGVPQRPAFTLQSRCGACRDLAVLFVDCCRAEGEQ